MGVWTRPRMHQTHRYNHRPIAKIPYFIDINLTMIQIPTIANYSHVTQSTTCLSSFINEIAANRTPDGMKKRNGLLKVFDVHCYTESNSRNYLNTPVVPRKRVSVYWIASSLHRWSLYRIAPPRHRVLLQVSY